MGLPGRPELSYKDRPERERDDMTKDKTDSKRRVVGKGRRASKHFILMLGATMAGHQSPASAAVVFGASTLFRALNMP